MNDKDQIKELFSNKLGNYRADVSPALWKGIASQIGGKTILGISSALFTKLIIGLGSALIIGVGVVAFKPNNLDDIKVNKVATVEIEEEESVTPTEKEKQKKEAVSLVKKEEKELIKEEVILTTEVIVKEQIEADITKDESLNKTTTIEELKEKEVIEEKRSYQEEDSNDAIEEEKDEIIKEDNNSIAYKIIKMPDVFSPNGDNSNDFFFIQTEGLVDFNVVILDESSSVVFQSSDVNFKWDGYNSFGEEVPNGRYVYFITAKDKNGNSVKEYKSLTVLR